MVAALPRLARMPGKSVERECRGGVPEKSACNVCNGACVFLVYGAMVVETVHFANVGVVGMPERCQ